MKFTLGRTKKVTRSVILLVAIGVYISTVVFMTKAANVVIVNDINPTFQFVKITRGDRWDSKGSLDQATPGKYILKTNSWAPWEDKDHVDFVYKKYAFNYGSQSTITISATLNSWESNLGSAGLMIRSSLKNSASNAFFFIRPNGNGSTTGTFMTYRTADEQSSLNTSYGPTPFTPIELRVTLNKTTFTGYYREKGAANWIKIRETAPFTHKGEIFVGMAAHSADEADLSTAVYENLSIAIDAPEGTVPGGGGGGTDTTTAEEIKVPDDLPLLANSNVLFRETFTDGSMFNESATPDISNPLWETKSADTDIVMTPDFSNRYFNSYFENAAYVAGDRKWTDYSTSLDLAFAENSPLSDPQGNKFMFFVRHTDVAQYGYNDYVVLFSKYQAGDDKEPMTKISLGYRTFLNSNINLDPHGGTYNTGILASANVDYLNVDTLGKFQELRVDTFDNIITVYWNGEKLFEYTDTGTKPNGNTSLIHTNGAIGFTTYNAAVMIDNIIVTKLNDYLGGDYDNKIGGNFNEPIPDYIKKYMDKKWNY